MGTLSYVVTSEGRNDNLQSAGRSASGTQATTTAAATVSGLTLGNRQVIKVVADEAMWIAFGGETAAIGTGHPLTGGIPEWFEIDENTAGAVSAIDTA